MRMFFDGWYGLIRVVLVGASAYAGLVLMLRVSGKRTLSKMNAFDFVVTVALGSTLASVLLSKDVPLAEGVLALALLVSLQYLITWMSVRSPLVDRVIKSDPVLLLHRGKFLGGPMREARVTEGEILAALRNHGESEVEGIEAVVLETDGSFSVIALAKGGVASALGDVRGRGESGRDIG
ncbi:MAG TPA: YetF domain-containing protein [Pyrinomonadaceae bacterium]|nr:YetF domain-containing protein [Pyrinomonadaceae bacterium]